MLFNMLKIKYINVVWKREEFGQIISLLLDGVGGWGHDLASHLVNDVLRLDNILYKGML